MGVSDSIGESLSTLDIARPDPLLSIAALGVLLLICIPVVLFHETAAPWILGTYQWIASNIGLLYQWAVIVILGLLLWLALGPYGRVVLGPDDEPPEFSTFSWVGMLFCTGVSASLIYFGTIEWAWYYNAPPLGLEPASVAAAEWAGAIGIHHWGPAGWAIYCLPAIAMAYPLYRRRQHSMRFSLSCRALLGYSRRADQFSLVIDVICMIGLIGGVATSFGVVTPLISAVLARLLGIEASLTLDILVLLSCFGLICISVWLGLERGIRRLSDFNMLAALVLALIFLVLGPTLFILSMLTDSLGLLVQNFVRLLTWTDPVEKTGFLQEWTIFYWAWWIAYAPFFGLFAARISRGRSIRAMVLAMLGGGTAASAVYFGVFGNSAMSLELAGVVPVVEMVIGDRGAYAITEVVLNLPLGELLLLVVGAIAMVFVVTTFDSSSYSLSACASRAAAIGAHPQRWTRVVWALALGLLPVLLLLLDSGQNQARQVIGTTSLVVSLPILGIGVLMVLSLLKSLREDYPA